VPALNALAQFRPLLCAGVIGYRAQRLARYELQWGERMVRSVANLTRRDGREFLALAAMMSIRAETEVFALEQANEALVRLKEGSLRGAAVLVP
jgi:propanol-preferring alcohol dehydrogenase